MTGEIYRVDLPRLSGEDLTGEGGDRLIRLMSGQARKALSWLEGERGQDGIYRIPDAGSGDRWPRHILYHASGSAWVFAVLARLAEKEQLPAGVARASLESSANDLLRAVAESHPSSGSTVERPDLWSPFSAIRTLFAACLGAWLIWDRLDADTRSLLTRLLAHEADLFNDQPAPAQLYHDTQAESNSWFGSGLALAGCMLPAHPHRDIWLAKAMGMMVSAYATPQDVASERVVDGKPLGQWLQGPNAFPDYAVENHGFVHPDYIAVVSEMVRSVICYRLAGEAIPESATFNATHVFDVLMGLNLPDGNHLYVQGSDYTSRRLDSFFQACNLLPLAPDPLREACFLRSLSGLERMADQRPDALWSGCLGFPFDLGVNWGLAENYLMRRLFGDGGPAIPTDEIEGRLAGVHISEAGRFAVHRTAKTLSSFSWHGAREQANLMGLTLPLEPDVLVSPLPIGGYVGEVTEAGGDPHPPRLVWSRIEERTDGFGAMVGVDRCGGKVRQHTAFVSLPGGVSVCLEERTASQTVEIDHADSGNVAVYDDLRWPFQSAKRSFYGDAGSIDPEAEAVHAGGWVNVDDRLGLVALGADAITFQRIQEVTDYDRWHLAFTGGATGTFSAGLRIGTFAVVTCPGQRRGETAALAESIRKRGWLLDAPGALAVQVGSHLVYAVFSCRHQHVERGDRVLELAPQCVGYLAG